MRTKYFHAQEWIKYLFLIAVLCRYTIFIALPERFLFLKSFVNYFQGTAIVLGLLSLVFYRQELKTKNWKELFPFGLFLISYSLTLLEQGDPSILALGGLLSYLVYVFLFAFSGPDFSYNQISKKITSINFFLIVMTFVFSTASIALYFSGTSLIVTDTLALGVADGRFYGITGSPNKDAILASISLILASINYLSLNKHSPAKLAFYIVNTLVQIAILSLGFSRGGELFLYLFPVFLSSLFVLKNLAQGEWKWRTIRPFAYGLICVAILKVLISTSSHLFNEQKELSRQTASIPQNTILGRHESPDVSSGRMELWTSCSKVAFENFWGVGFPNIDTECMKANPGKHLSGISAGMHNVFMQAWVGSGMIGLIATVGMILSVLLKLWGVIKRSWSSHQDQPPFLYPSLALILCLMVYALYENGPLFSHNIPSLLFWIYLGYIFTIERIALGSRVPKVQIEEAQ